MKIHLRKRIGQLSLEKQKNGKKQMTSLFLTYYDKIASKTRYEFLDLHLYTNPKTNEEKYHNKQTLQLAENLQSKKLLDMQTTNHGFVSNERSKINFLEYFKELTEKKRDSYGNYGNWMSAYQHLVSYCNNRSYTLEQIDEYFLESFKEYLLKTKARRGSDKLSTNSTHSYFNKLRAALKEAYMNKMIKENPCEKVRALRALESTRQFLTLEEIKSLVATTCKNEFLKKAFLFSALTGLRWSDVKALSWSKIKYSQNGGYSIHFTQKKTKASEVLPISDQAIKMLGEPLEDKSKEIFKSLTYSTAMNKKLEDWIFQAGIHKKITFHCARHSFATLQLSMNTDIYTVSKLLGHKHIKTTEIYAKVIDQKKIDAVKRIPELI